MRNLLLAVLLPLLALCLGACGSTGPRTTPQGTGDLEGSLLGTETSGDEWLAEAALATGSRAAGLYLNAAQAYLLEQRFDALGAVLATVELPPGRAALSERYARLRAAWHLSEGDVDIARQWLGSAPAPRRTARIRRSEAGRARAAAVDDYWLLAAAIGEAAADWAATASALAQVEDAERYRRSPWFAEQQAAGALPDAIGADFAGSARNPVPQSPMDGAQQPGTAPGPAQQVPLIPPSTAQPSPPQSAPLAAAIVETDARQTLHDHLWRALNRTQRSAALTAAAAAEPRQRGWWDLRLAVAAAPTLEARRSTLQRWQRQHGGHPGAFPWPRALQALARPAIVEPPLEVALLLPLSGPLSAAGNAIRDGFIATQLEADLPLVARFYDVSAAPLPQVLETAAGSADVIIGPVTKDRVSEIARLRPDRPILALNYLDPSAPQPGAVDPESEPPSAAPEAADPAADSPFTAAVGEVPFQLGIAIEDEARTLIAQLERSGIERLLVIHGTASWAQRAATAIAAEWSGYLRTAQFESVKTVTESIGDGMLIDDSHRRAQQLRRTIGQHIEFIPRARQDLDAIVALVSPVEAEVLRPALRFHFAERVPVFSTSQLLRSRDIEDQPGLSGIQLTELPGLLTTEEPSRRFNEAFGLPASPLSGLYTLGADAARLAQHLPLLQQQPAFAFDGATGALTLAADGRRLQRELGWAVLNQGRARPAPVVRAERGVEEPAATRATNTISGSSASGQ
ncbi:MAG: penicillin-binding protein activator [Pseudomonadota bacterium]